jgi:hypothetical protein
MAPFTQEQLDFLNKHFAPLPHNHTWEQVVDTDGQTISEAFENLDEAISELGEGSDEDEDEDEETTG